MSVSPNQWFAALVVLVCVALLVRMCLPSRHRAALDATLRRLPGRVLARTKAVCKTLWHWRHWRSRRDDAARLAEEAIQRARRTRADKDGNVIRPEAFKGPRKPH